MTDIPVFEDAKLEVDGRVAIFTLNRHDQRNTLTGNGMIQHIVDMVDWVNGNKEISAVVITGDGSAFSAGGNIKAMANRSDDFGGDAGTVAQSYRDGIQRIPLAIDKLEVPIIAAVNGPAIGAGCDLTCMCDIRIASTKAKFGETFVNLGLIPGDGGAYFLQQLVGYQRAAELTLTGRIVDGAEAVEIGLALEVVEPEELMNRTELRDFLDQCAFYQAVCHQTEDHHEAIMAFIEKRTANFTAR
jgi:enoyl-CoA hydratase/carnithine racemase